MKRNHTLLASLIFAAGLSGVAIAQGGPRGANMGPGCDGSGPGAMADGRPMGRHAAMQADPGQRVERHMAMLKYQLNITDAQEPLWQAYEQKMKDEAGQGMQAMKAQADQSLPAPERMAKMQSMMEERLTAMKAVHEQFNRLYAALTPEQKTKADKFVGQMGQGPRSTMRR